MSERLGPFPREAWSELLLRLFPAGHEMTDTSDEGGRRRSGPPNILLTIGRVPGLLEPFLGFANALATTGTLPRREGELLALRAAWHCRSAFEWGHHVEYALDAGLSEADVDRVVDGPDAAGWGEVDAALLRAADELHTAQKVSDATWAVLRGAFDDAQLVQIPFIVGHYTMLSMVASSTDVPLEPGLPALPERG